MLICVSVHGCDSGMPCRPNHPLFRVQFSFLYGAPLSADDGFETLVFVVQLGQLSKMCVCVCVCVFQNAHHVRISQNKWQVWGSFRETYRRHTRAVQTSSDKNLQTEHLVIDDASLVPRFRHLLLPIKKDVIMVSMLKCEAKIYGYWDWYHEANNFLTITNIGLRVRYLLAVISYLDVLVGNFGFEHLVLPTGNKSENSLNFYLLEKYHAQRGNEKN